MIREITGMLVMAIAIANTRKKDPREPAVPSHRRRSSTASAPRPARNGSAIPATLTDRIVRRSPRRRADRISEPAENMSSRRPS
jgi:hypothetical protein